ncbi:Dehydroquinate synthase-like protein [Eremomyces bilateralis CBS 781.70]|uniref:Dehydroquinate synthase-like protein n=1 Tax=Eremomyces bilateralis CBS 781.70 TaxID=1392243 RepID=A0A6G1GF03_9PEZI|nr:Dehydroquinate synthase-like protein [Eremomyces bilateralis CBS 781.70]KAF1816582.1 Dehydroquinate synthase-like protein [Eremomyces bilateralis CBS 781.70]
MDWFLSGDRKPETTSSSCPRDMYYLYSKLLRGNLRHGVDLLCFCLANHPNYFKASNIIIIISESLSTQTEHVKGLADALSSCVVCICNGLRPRTLWSEVLDVVKEIQPTRYRPTHHSRALANNATTVEDLSRMNANLDPRDMVVQKVPIISVPTSLSGDGTSRGPELIVLDAEMCRATLDWVWYSTAVRALDYCVETILSPERTGKGSEAAMTGLRRLVPALLRCRHAKDPHREDQARHYHGIGHQLGPFGVGHWETSCVLLPAVCKYNAQGKEHAERQQIIMKALGDDPENQCDMGDAFDTIITELGMVRKLENVGVGAEELGEQVLEILRAVAG